MVLSQLSKCGTKIMRARSQEFIVIFTLAILTGCKIEITSPNVGYIANAEGETVCQTGVRCTVDVTRSGTFDETYTAVPLSGYEFSGWLEKHQGFCGGSLGSCRLTSEPIKNNERLSPILDTNRVFFLEPQFRRIQSFADINVCETSFLGSNFHSGDTIRLANNALVKVDASTNNRFFSPGTSEYLLSYFPSGVGVLASREDDPKLSYVTVVEPPRQCSRPRSYFIRSISGSTARIGGYDFEPSFSTFGRDDTYSCEGLTLGDELVFLDGAPDGRCSSATVQSFGGYRFCELRCL